MNDSPEHTARHDASQPLPDEETFGLHDPDMFSGEEEKKREEVALAQKYQEFLFACEPNHIDDEGFFQAIETAYQKAKAGDAADFDALYALEMGDKTEEERALLAFRGPLAFLETYMARLFPLHESEEDADDEALKPADAVEQLKKTYPREAAGFLAVFSALEALKQELSAQHSAGYKRTADILALHETVREKSGQCIDSFFVLFLAPSEKKDAETAKDPQEKRIEALEHLLVFLKTTERDLVKDKMEREEGEEERDGRHEEDEEAEEPAGMHERSDTKTPAVLDKEKKDAGQSSLSSEENARREFVETGAAVAVTRSIERVKDWEKMNRTGFFSGTIRYTMDGVYILSVSHAVLPWCWEERKTFFEKSQGYRRAFADAFTHLKRPDNIPFPESVFLDETGEALDLYLQDRFTEFLSRDRYRILQEEYGLDDRVRIGSSS